ncbi:MAG: DMT family transporter [Rhodospirillales bacterium]|jgi:drug/metabolite transporter (DMT)-like permease|nr:DMT family transporter [Rhodospirillales bacterium]MBT4625675.1 DMT family transporter [Rhodospirillales bacterium]MBT7505980.1 DMT family transporter [Rhodospirillales bacterium]MBT7779622.1 DMT family transporter [Rhodospirillales bacterium]
MTHMSTDNEPASRKVGVLAYVLLLCMGVAWGLAISLSKIAAVSGGHPVTLGLWQVCVSGSLLFGIGLFWFRPSMPRPSVISFSMFCGITGVSIPAMILFWCAIYLPAGIVAIAFASMPLFTYVLSVLFRVEQGNVIRFLGVVVGLAAMALLILPDAALPSPDMVPWVLLALLASVFMSAENTYAGGMRPEGISSLQLSCGRQLGAIVFLTPIALLFADPIPVFEPWGRLQWSATGAGILSGGAFTCLLYVIRTSGPVFASQSAYIITLAGVAWGMVLFGERHSVYIWAALALVLAGSALVTPRVPKLFRLFTQDTAQDNAE